MQLRIANGEYKCIYALKNGKIDILKRLNGLKKQYMSSIAMYFSSYVSRYVKGPHHWTGL